MHIVSIIGARPNFVKIAPIAREIKKRDGIKHTIIHTGQHYDEKMSKSFFETLDIPHPDINLGIGSGSHGVQTGKIMMEIEPVFMEIKPDIVLTVGDVNSTAAAALVAVKLGIKTVHVEAGLRSFDREMPEEINRLVTDAISDLLLVTEQSGYDNLLKEGVPEEKIKFTGNVMIDSLCYALNQARELNAWEKLSLEKGNYLLVTLHRPSNVDNPDSLGDLLEALIEVSKEVPVFFPMHPRTKANIEKFGYFQSLPGIDRLHISEPEDYITFLSLIIGSKALLTDSGGIQEETTYLGIPCITLRKNTERPSTIELGTNELIDPVGSEVKKSVEKLLSGNWKKGTIPPLWDGNAASRVLDELQKLV